jgi:hypothetical protein
MKQQEYSLDDEIIDPFLLQSVRNSLGDQNGKHDRYDISEGIGQFENNDGERNSSSGDSSKCRCSSDLVVSALPSNTLGYTSGITIECHLA